MNTVLSVEDLYVDLGQGENALAPVRGVSFEVRRGEILGIVGESGCGKSLTSLAIMGLLPKNARRRAKAIRLGETDLSRIADRPMADLRGNRIAMIFQEPMTSLNPLLTIGEQLVEVYLRHGRGNARQAHERAMSLLDRVGMNDARNRMLQYPHQLSGGLRQRVMIAMALMCEPDLIIADEPTTALDVTIQAQVLGLFKKLQQELGLSIIFITHDLGVIARLADRVAVMYGGQVVESAPTRKLFANPSHPYTNGLLACLPRIGHCGHLQTIPGTVRSFTSGFVGCGFANRCAHVADECVGHAIPVRSIEPEHSFRCVLSRGAGTPPSMGAGNG